MTRSKSTIRIGTWNLEGKWSADHHALLSAQNCQIWLLTEVPTAIAADFHIHHTSQLMQPSKYWAGILSIDKLTPVSDPHPASAAALIAGVAYCSSILPWATCGSEPTQPWRGSSLEEKTKTAIEPIEKLLKDKTTVWGGDWNQNLQGEWEHVGSGAMRGVIESTVESLGLQVTTRKLPHRLQGSHTIDHIAIPEDWTLHHSLRVSAHGLSDHDLYWIEATKS